MMHLENASRIVAERNTDHLLQNRSGIVTRCWCGGKLDRAGLELVYCETCGAEYFARQLRRPHTFHLTRIPG
jgi:hypothetical protein